jgi:hypothetical protein
VKTRFEPAAPWDVNLKRLAGVSHCHRPSEPQASFAETLLSQIACRFTLELGKNALQLSDIQPVSFQHYSSRIVLYHVAKQHTQCRECPRRARNEYLRDPKRRRQIADVQSAGASEAHKSEQSRVLSPLNRHNAKRGLHICVGDSNHTQRRALDTNRLLCEACHLGGQSRKDRSCTVEIDRHLTAKQARAAKASENKIGVGDCYCFASTITGWPGISAGGFWTDAERSSGVDSRDRSASRAHSVNVDNRHRHRQPSDQSLIRRAGSSAAQRDISRRATHVKGNDVLKPGCGAESQCANDAPGGA